MDPIAAFAAVDRALAPMLAAVPEDGACWRAEFAIPDPGHTWGSLILAATVQLAAAPGSPRRGDAALIARARAMARWLRGQQRPTGRLDLLPCNYDSGPDSAFAWQLLIPARAWAAAVDPALAAELDAVLRPGLVGLIDGGFHTPNHRWVTASALAQGCVAYPDLAPRLRPVFAALVAEEPDIDDEGAFIERSIAIYDAVCCRALFLADAALGWPAGRDAAIRCLRLDRDLLHPDGSCETGLSHRQDHGTKVVPVGLAANYHWAEQHGAGDLAGTAAWLWSRATSPDLASAFWTVHALLAHGPAAPAAAPPDLERAYPRNGCWRLRRGALSATAFTGATRLLGLRWGALEIAAVQVGQSYMGHGRFVADRLTPRPGGVTLHAPGHVSPHRLGYSQPLGRPVGKDGWDAAWPERGLRALPPCRTRIEIDAVADDLDLRVVGEDGLDGVTAQIAIDVPPGVEVITDHLAGIVAKDQELWLRAGHAVLRQGNDTLTIGPGSAAHRMVRMRDFPKTNGLGRLIIALRTPIDHRITIRCGRE